MPTKPKASTKASKKALIDKVEKNINKCLQKWVPLLGLSHIDMFIAFVSELESPYEDEDEKAYAFFEYDEVHGRLTIYFEEEMTWFEDGFSTELILLHELMHIKLYDLRALHYKLMDTFVPAKQQKFIESEFRDKEEATVDSLARIFDQLLKK